MADYKIECAHDKIVEILDLKPHPLNPNQHNEEQIRLLAHIMKAQGVRNPIVVSNQSGFMVAGHARRLAALHNGWTNFPVDYQDFENQASEHAHMIADNTIAELAQRDDEMIKKIALDLPKGFDLQLIGLPDFELKQILFNRVEEVNKGDESAEWVDMPEFDPKDKDIKLIFIFDSEEERAQYVEQNNIEVTSKFSNQWTCRR